MQLRLLEQIKIRDRITLRSPESITTLARFREAVIRNSSTHILGRFSTTAIPGREQEIQFPRNLTGIAAWSSVKDGDLAQHEVEEFVTAFKNVVALVPCPQGLQESVFTQFQDYVASADSQTLVEELIKRFEWATGLPDPPQLHAEIQSLLLNQSRANTQEEAQLLADVLTVHVFHLLAQSGEKRLAVGELDRLLSERSLTEVDRRILTRIVQFVEQAESYFSHLTTRVESMSEGITALQVLPPQIDQLLRQVSDIQTQFLPVQLPPPDDLPNLPIGFASRTEFMQTLIAQLSNVTWVYIMGATGMGKTIAARLVAEAHGLGRVAWISLRGEQTAEGLRNRLEMHLLRLASTLDDRPDLACAYTLGMLSFSALVRCVALRLGSGGLLVIDEIPDLLTNPLLGDRLVELTMALHESGGNLLTTSQRSIPSSVVERIEGAMSEIDIPPMTQQDINEMLTAADAPPEFHHPSWLNLIQNATSGHPALIAGTVSFLKHNPRVDQGQLLAILTGDPTGEVRTEARRKLFHLVSTDNARELLYRLSLISTPFDMALMRAVAAATPSISRPAELLAELVGPWINRLAADCFEISPLLSNAGQTMLDFSSQQVVHLAVASQYMKKRTIDQYEAFRIITHLHAACGWEQLTGFVVRLAFQLTEKSHADTFEFFTFFFTSWPDDMPVSFRIVLRAVQIRIRTLLGKDAQNLINDLDAMIQQADASLLTDVFMALWLIGPFNPAAGSVMVAQRTLQLCRIYRRLPAEWQSLSTDKPLESLVWVGVRHVRTRDDIRGVLNVIAEMMEEERRAAFDDLREGHQILVDHCWILERAKAEEEQSWESVLSLVEEVHRVSQLPGAEPLYAAAARVKAMVLADYMGQPERAMEIIEEALSSADSYARFLLHYTAGCLLLDHSTPDTALQRYQQALSEPSIDSMFLHFDALRRAAEAAGRAEEWQTMRDLAIQSLKLLKKQDILYYEQLEMIGEIAWAHWSLGNHIKACAAMSGLVRGLVQKDGLEDRRFREVLRKTGHVLGWMMSMSRTGNPPSHTLDGQPYADPFPGWFARQRPHFADIPLPSFPPIPALLNQFALFAIRCKFYELAWHSLNEARRILDQSQVSPSFRHTVDMELSELAAYREQYKESLHFALSGIRAIAITQHIKELGIEPAALDSFLDAFADQESHKDAWGKLSKEHRRDMEGILFWTTVGPAITGLLAREVPAEEYAAVIEELRTTFQESEHELADPEYWLNLIKELRFAFSPFATRQAIRERIRTLSESDLHLRLLLYLALCLASDVSPLARPRALEALLAEDCGAQAVVFELLLRTHTIAELMAEDIAIYIFRYWQQVAESRGFALHDPTSFRKGISMVQRPTLSDVAKILLLASYATGVNLSDELRKNLWEAAKIT